MDQQPRTPIEEAAQGPTNRASEFELPEEYVARDEFAKWTATASTSVGYTVAVIFIDVDNFKALNTRLSEPTVDKIVLPPLIRLLAAATLDRGGAYRPHAKGDEFICILPNCEIGEAAAFVHTLSNRIREHVFADESKTTVQAKITISTGIAVWPRDGSDFDGVYQKAAERKQLAKDGGRDQMHPALEGALGLRRPTSTLGIAGTPNTFAKEYATPGTYLVDLVGFLGSAQERVRIVYPPKNGRWVFYSLAALIKCRQRDIPIDLIVEDIAWSSAYEMLEGIGCNVTRTKSPAPNAFSGVLVDPSNRQASTLVCFSKGVALGSEPYASSIFGSRYSSAIGACASTIRDPGGQAKLRPIVPQLVRMRKDALVKRLKKVPDYKPPGIRIDLAKVPLSRIVPAGHVLQAKLEQAHELLQLYRNAGFEFFEPAALSVEPRVDGKRRHRWSAMVPPVLEKIGAQFRVAEGHTRLYQLREEEGVSAEIWAIVVDNVTKPPKVPQTTWEKLQVKLDFDHGGQNAREIERYVHGKRRGGEFDYDWVRSSELVKS